MDEKQGRGKNTNFSRNNSIIFYKVRSKFITTSPPLPISGCSLGKSWRSSFTRFRVVNAQNRQLCIIHWNNWKAIPSRTFGPDFVTFNEEVNTVYTGISEFRRT